MPFCGVRGLTAFGGVVAVRGVDLEVAWGERRAVLGPNGAGKTTLFNLIAGDSAYGRLDRTVREDVTSLPKRARTRLGMTRTYQISRLFAGLTVEDNLYLASLGVAGGHFSRIKRARRDAADREQARAIAESVGIRPRSTRCVGDALARRAAAAGDRHGAGRAGRRCCCSTSRRPGCRRPSGSR